MIKYVVVEGKDQLKQRIPKEYQYAYNNGDMTLEEIRVEDAALQFTDETSISYTEAWDAGLLDGVDGVAVFSDISAEEVAKFNLIEGDIATDGTVSKSYFDSYSVVYAEAFATV